MITWDDFNYSLSDKEKARIKYLIEEELPSVINRFEWKFLKHIRDNGPAPITDFGRAWVHYALNQLEYDNLSSTSNFGESYWEHNHISENDEGSYIDPLFDWDRVSPWSSSDD